MQAQHYRQIDLTNSVPTFLYEETRNHFDNMQDSVDKPNRIMAGIAGAALGVWIGVFAMGALDGNGSTNTLNTTDTKLVEIQNIERNTGQVSSSACNFLRKAPSELVKEREGLDANAKNSVFIQDMLRQATHILHELRREAPKCVAKNH